MQAVAVAVAVAMVVVPRVEEYPGCPLWDAGPPAHRLQLHLLQGGLNGPQWRDPLKQKFPAAAPLRQPLAGPYEHEPMPQVLLAVKHTKLRHASWSQQC